MCVAPFVFDAGFLKTYLLSDTPVRLMAPPTSHLELNGLYNAPHVHLVALAACARAPIERMEVVAFPRALVSALRGFSLCGVRLQVTCNHPVAGGAPRLAERARPPVMLWQAPLCLPGTGPEP